MLSGLWHRAEIVQWVSENHLSFNIVNDEVFHSLMKTGRTGQYLPSASMVSKDVKGVFAWCRSHIAKLLQVRTVHVSLTAS